MEKVIQQGAEAFLIKRGDEILKRRVKKNYRLEILDEKLRKTRTKKEAKILEKVAKLIPTPRVLKINEKTFEIEMEFLDGEKLSEVLDDLKNWKEVCFEIGKNIAAIHDADVIHGDLTTSNMILVDDGNRNFPSENSSLHLRTNLLPAADSPTAHPNDEIARASRSRLSALAPLATKINNSKKISEKNISELKVYFIDYGLGFENGKIEDKAVDLHLIKQALEAKHFSNWENFFAEILRGYKKSKNYKATMERFEKVEKRGRYKAQY